MENDIIVYNQMKPRGLWGNYIVDVLAVMAFVKKKALRCFRKQSIQ